ncbi:MFS transporter [Marinobacterium sediminicola]|uniref:MFS transporter, YNFM family, putative membrane transport protein n=1 Tax=Marinobacterium sediminicola TaxID=518898 RepID=A0ABY1S1U7_9GAMM|nr:MFS transporter [Marinobacterium sediminicola]ULG69509.1 MFS transporter [Marinobacterium sediminicola]SMR75659.1 MFS transporter, YNFM family, putative membrane transport protein [Marinobacterium sediminicola]
MIVSGSAAFWRATLALCLGSFMIFSNVYVTQPLLPMLAEAFQVSPLQAGWTFTVTTLTLGLSLLIWGPLSDALGRRWIMLLTMGGATLVTLLLSFIDSYTGMLVLRAVQGVLLAGLPAIAIAWMGDEFERPAVLLAVGLYIGGNSLGGISGRLIGGFVGDWLGWSEAFLVMTLISLLCLILFALLLPASRHFQPQPVKPRRMLADLRSHLGNPVLLLAYLIGGFNFFIFINQYSYITFVLADEPYSLPASLLGMLFLTYLAGTFGSAISGKVGQKLAQPLCMALGIMVLMAGSLLTLSSQLWLIVLGFLVNSFGFFFAHSSASSWVSQNATHARASASSLYLLFYYTGASTGGFYLHPFWEWQAWNGVVVGSLMVLAVTLSLSLCLYRLQQRQLNAALA